MIGSDWPMVRGTLEGLQHAREGARQSLSRAGAGARRAAVRTRDLAGDNRVAVLAVTVAAGLGIGLLWPTGTRTRPRERTY